MRGAPGPAGIIGGVALSETKSKLLPRTADNAPYVKLFITRPRTPPSDGAFTPPRAQVRYVIG